MAFNLELFIRWIFDCEIRSYKYTAPGLIHQRTGEKARPSFIGLYPHSNGKYIKQPLESSSKIPLPIQPFFLFLISTDATCQQSKTYVRVATLT